MKDRRGGHDGVVLKAFSHFNIKLVVASLRIANEERHRQKNRAVQTDQAHCRPDEDPLQIELQNPQVEEEDTEFGETEA